MYKNFSIIVILLYKLYGNKEFFITATPRVKAIENSCGMAVLLAKIILLASPIFVEKHVVC